MLIPGALLAAPEVSAELTESRIYVGESVRYRVTLKDCDPSVEPQLDRFNDFAVRLLGKTLGSQSTVIVNGRVRSFTQGGTVYEYLLTPKRSGKLTLPAPTIEVAGQLYTGPTLELEVADPDQQDIVFLELSVDRPEVYPLQRFTVKLNVAVKGLPNPVADREPIAVQRQLPQIVMPWADDENLPDGIAAVQPAGEWLRQYLEDRRQPIGFGINNVRSHGGARRPFGGFGGFPDLDEMLRDSGFSDADSMFSMFTEESRAAFHPPPRQALRDDLQNRKVNYWEYVFERTFTSSKLGDHTFGPASLKGVFAKRTNSSGRLEGEQIYAVSDSITVRTKDAPMEGRPANYIGAIGSFTAGSQLSPTDAKVGDPMTLTIWLHGHGTLSGATPPKIESEPEISQQFKVYEATDSTEGDTRRFTYSLRPKQAGVKQFPAVELAYFSIADEKYITLKTEPIAINVAPAEKLAQSEIELPATATSAVAPEAQTGGIFANITDLDELKDESVDPDRWLLALSSMAITFFATAIVVRYRQRSRSDPAGQRRRGAVRRVRTRLNDSRRLIADGSERAGADSISSSLRGLIADLGNFPEQGLTAGDVRTFLSQQKLPETLQHRFLDILEQCDAARYGAAQRPLVQLGEDAEALLNDMNRELRERGFKLS